MHVGKKAQLLSSGWLSVHGQIILQGVGWKGWRLTMNTWIHFYFSLDFLIFFFFCPDGDKLFSLNKILKSTRRGSCHFPSPTAISEEGQGKLPIKTKSPSFAPNDDLLNLDCNPWIFMIFFSSSKHFTRIN